MRPGNCAGFMLKKTRGRVTNRIRSPLYIQWGQMPRDRGTKLWRRPYSPGFVPRIRIGSERTGPAISQVHGGATNEPEAKTSCVVAIGDYPVRDEHERTGSGRLREVRFPRPDFRWPLLGYGVPQGAGRPERIPVGR